jgi:hypothetical protein
VAGSYRIPLRSLPHSGFEMSKHGVDIRATPKLTALYRIGYTVSPAVAALLRPLWRLDGPFEIYPSGSASTTRDDTKTSFLFLGPWVRQMCRVPFPHKPQIPGAKIRRLSGLEFAIRTVCHWWPERLLHVGVRTFSSYARSK